MSMRSELDTLTSEISATGSTVSAAGIVEAAKNAERFPALNKHLWQVSDATLATEARLQRAHRLLITMRVTVAETGETTRMLVHTPGTSGYQPINNVVSIPDVALMKVRQLVEDIGRARARLRAFRAALPEEVVNEIDEALATAETKAGTAISPETRVAV